MDRPAANPSGDALLERIRAQSEASPERIAIDCPYAGRLSYARLIEHIQDTQDQLEKFQFDGCCIAYELPISAAQIVLALATLGSGQCLPINPAWSETEKQHCLEQHCAMACFTDVDQPTFDGYPTFSIDLATLQFREGERLLSQDGEDRSGLILHTSGSSGQPKALLLRNEQLLAGTSNVIQSLNLGCDDVVLHCLPPFHVGAFVDVVLAPLHSGGAICLSKNANPDEVLARLKHLSCSWYQAVPTMSHALLQRAIETEQTSALKGLRFLRSVSSAMPQSWAEEWLRYSSVPITEIYGMSETAGVIASPDAPQAKFRSGWVGKPINQAVMIVDRSGNACDAGVAGEIWVRGDNVFNGYIGEPLRKEGVWFATGDEGSLDEEGCLTLLGRKKELINRGGEKISPLEVDAALLTCEDVADAACFAIAHQSLGEVVAAAVVPAARKKLLPEALKRQLSSRLAAYKIPQQIVFLNELPRTAGGKLQRHRLPQFLVTDTHSERSDETISDPLMQTLLAQWRQALGKTDIHPQDDFFELGGDSLIAANLMANLAEVLDQPLPLTSLFEFPTLTALHSYLQRALLQDVLDEDSVSATEQQDELDGRIRPLLSAWPGKPPFRLSLLMANHTMGLNPPLFWGCQDGGELAALCQALGPEQPVYGFRSMLDVQGRSQQANHELALRYVDDVLRLVPEGPILIGGFCEAGKIAFEMARILEQRKRTPALLILMEQFIPQHYGGRTALIFCEDSKYSPWRHSHWPEYGWRKFYRGPLISVRCGNRHRQFFTDGVLLDTAKILREQLELTVHELPYLPYREGTGEVPDLPVSPVLPDLSQALVIEDFKVVLGEMPLAECVIRNVSTSTIDLRSAGISAHMRLRRCYDGRIKIWRFGARLLDCSLASDESMRLDIAVDIMPGVGLWQAELSLREEGLSFAETDGVAVDRFWLWPAFIRRGLRFVRQQIATIMK